MFRFSNPFGYAKPPVGHLPHLFWFSYPYGYAKSPVGHNVISQGDPGEKFYIIALLESGRRTATIQTVLPTLFLTLERKHFPNRLANHPDLRLAIDPEARSRKSGLDTFHNLQLTN